MTKNRFIVGILLIVLAVNAVSLIVSLESNSHTNRNTSKLEGVITEVKESREQAIITSCNEENERHIQAGIGLRALVVKNTPKTATPAERAKTNAVLGGFVDALVPHYDCAKRLKEQTTR